MPRPVFPSFRAMHKGLLALVLSAGAVVVLILAEGMVLRWMGFNLFHTERRYSILHYCPPRGDRPALAVYWLCEGSARSSMRHCLELIRPADQGEPATYEWNGITPRSAVRIGDQGNVAFVSIEGTIYTWDTSNPGEMPEVLGSHKACANVLAVTGGGRRLVAASDVRLSAWDLQRREMIWSRDDVGVMTLAIHPTSGTITCGTTMGQVLEVDMATGNSLRTVTEHVGGVDCLAISADGTKMASIGVDRRLTLCDWSTGQTLWTRPHHANSEVCLSPDGQTLVTSGFVDNAWAIVTWNTATGEEKQKLLGHRNVILGLHVTPDNTLYSWGTDGTVRTWDMRRATVISTWVPHPPYEEVQDVQVNCS